MRVYADTSWWLAYKCRRDVHHPRAVTLFDREPDAQVVWTPWQRVEVFNTFRQAERAGLVAPGESRQLLRRLEQEVRLGYWPHLEFDWTFNSSSGRGISVRCTVEPENRHAGQLLKL